MARKPRIEFAGALYHVINRGNYRRDLFETAGAAQAFETCLYEACGQFGWQLHAYAIMRNHFHLALETPRGNLVVGMHWLQSTFATRFNRFRDEHGHLFQSRYQALLIEAGRPLVNVVNYIHLNPVRAGIVPFAQLGMFRWCSYRRFVRGDRPPFLVCAEWLREIRALPDSGEGWKAYAAYLECLSVDVDEQKFAAFDQMTKGWAIGSAEWRAERAREHAAKGDSGALMGSDLAELREAAWEQEVEKRLAKAHKTPEHIQRDACGAPWKLAIARAMRQTTAVTNRWLARRLGMGAESTVSTYLSRTKHQRSVRNK